MRHDTPLAMQTHGCFAHLTDLHCNPLAKDMIPQGRTETYHEDCQYEWEAFRTECVQQGVCAVLMSGDFFNLKNSGHYRPRDLHHYSEQVERFEVPWYVIPGNHDLPQSSMEHYPVSALRALVKMTPNMANVMDTVAEEVLGPAVTSFSVFVAGSPYDQLEPTFERLLPSLDARLADKPGYRIALVHTDMMPPGSKPLPGHWNMASYDDVLDALPAADLVCGGHIHNGGHIHTRPDPRNPGRFQHVSKPFSFGRVVKDYFATTADLEAQHVPTYSLIRFRSLVDACGLVAGPVQVDIEERVIPHVSFKAAFVADSLRRVLEQEAGISAFVESLRQRNAEQLSGRDLVDPDEAYRLMDLPEKVRAKIDEYCPG